MAPAAASMSGAAAALEEAADDEEAAAAESAAAETEDCGCDDASEEDFASAFDEESARFCPSGRREESGERKEGE